MEYYFDDIDMWAQREAMNLELYSDEVKSNTMTPQSRIQHFHQLRDIYTKRIQKYARLKKMTYCNAIDYLVSLHRKGVNITQELNAALNVPWAEFRKLLVSMGEYPFIIK